jgi:hypothetical protein
LERGGGFVVWPRADEGVGTQRGRHHHDEMTKRNK